jgi:two-component system cell cycle response regulator
LPTDKPTRILIADEDDVLTSTLAWLLKEQGYEVAVARGDRVLEQLRALAPDILLIDVEMEATDGYALLGRLREEDRFRDMPVLVVSSLPAEDVTAKLLSLGATDFIGKPFHVRELLARIQVQKRLRQELVHARARLRSMDAELQRARDEAESRRKLVDILHEVTGDFSAEELYHILVRRVARALDITHCSLILARPGDITGTVVTAYENSALRNLEIRLERYPEIRQALDTNLPVLVEDVSISPLYAEVREEWLASGRAVLVRSVIALPFELDDHTGGVFFLRTVGEAPPLTAQDVEFADTVVRAAVGAIRRAHVMESTMADNVRLELLARTDPLTQTLNRRALMDRLATELERARRYGLRLTVLMIDIDHFKAVNDSYGHLVGDEALREVARILQREARTVDVVARYGGEEFVVMLPETTDEGAMALAERIRQRIEEQPMVGGEAYSWLRVTVSIGVATVSEQHRASTEDLIAQADEALYRAKSEGRNRVCK